MEWITDLFRSHPELAIYLVLGMGFLVGRVHIQNDIQNLPTLLITSQHLHPE